MANQFKSYLEFDIRRVEKKANKLWIFYNNEVICKELYFSKDEECDIAYRSLMETLQNNVDYLIENSFTPGSSGIWEKRKPS